MSSFGVSAGGGGSFGARTESGGGLGVRARPSSRTLGSAGAGRGESAFLRRGGGDGSLRPWTLGAYPFTNFVPGISGATGCPSCTGSPLFGGLPPNCTLLGQWSGDHDNGIDCDCLFDCPGGEWICDPNAANSTNACKQVGAASSGGVAFGHA